MRRALLGLAIAPAISITFGASPAFAAGTFLNPVIAEDWPDPTVWKGEDGFYYSVATRLRTVRRSANLVDWEDLRKDPLTSAARFALTNLTSRVWAPSVARLGGRWVMHVSLFVNSEDNRIQALVADTPGGPFSFHGNVIDSRREGIFNTIDPYAFEHDGRVWLFFGSCQDGIHCVELTADGLSIKPGAPIVHVAGHRASKTNRQDLWGKPGAYEGSYVLNRRGWCYLFVSSGKYDDGTYCLSVGRAKTVDGIFFDRKGHSLTQGLAEPILKGLPGARFFGPGHNGNVFSSVDGRDWMFFHAHDHNRARAADRPTLLQELRWTADGWPYFDGGVPRELEECPVLGNCGDKLSQRPVK